MNVSEILNPNGDGVMTCYFFEKMCKCTNVIKKLIDMKNIRIVRPEVSSKTDQKNVIQTLLKPKKLSRLPRFCERFIKKNQSYWMVKIQNSSQIPSKIQSNPFSE
jgi:hypothetical protein